MSRPPSDTASTLGRLLRILMLVASRPPHRKIGRRDLADACSCGVRCIGRDLHRLGEAGLPVEWDASGRTYFLPDKGWSLPFLKLTAADVMALGLARGLLTAPSVPFANAIRSALEKLTVGIPGPLVSLLEAEAAFVHTTGKARDYSRAPLAALIRAASQRDSVEIDYESRRGGERSWRRIDPYGIDDHDGRLDLQAWCHRNREIRSFALDRVSGVRESGLKFVVREEEWTEFQKQSDSIGGLRGGPEVEVRVRFAPEAAPYARDLRWPASLHTTLLNDGSLLLAGTVRGMDGLVPELLRWRRLAVVIGGPELLARMREEVQAMAALYRDEPAIIP